jgi:signal transduction histidine kinase
LKSLLLLLIGLSLVVWLATAFFCRRLAHRALEPLRRLASSARGLDAADPGWSLDRIGTGDELDELSQAINDLLARLHLAYERQRRISSDASHQLRTPLTVLIGQIEVALRHDRSVEEYRRVLNSARARAVQLAQIVEALLFLGRSEGEADQPRGEPIDLNSWVASHIASRSQTDLTSVVSYRATQPEPLPVQFHPTLLAQLLENLIDNALKHGRSVAGPSIRVETGREGATAWLAVEDDGPGISPDDADRIFEPFYRSALARRNGIAGTGLGLPVVRRIATAFGGVVLLQPKRGAGCRFEVRLPLLEETGEATWSNRLSQAGSAERTETPAMALRRSLKE